MKKVIPITGLILSITLSNVSAATDITKNNFDITTGVLTIEGVTDNKDGMVSLSIPKAGITSSQLDSMSDNDASNSLLYCEQIKVGENGSFKFTVTIPQSTAAGVYNISIGDDDGGVPEQSSFYNMNKSDYGILIESLNSAAKNSKSDFEQVYDSNENKLFCLSNITPGSKNVIKEILYDYAKNTGFSKTDSVTNMKVYKAALVSQLIIENRIQDAEKLFGDMFTSANGNLMKYNTINDFYKYVNTDQKKTFFTGVFANPNSISQFENAFVDSVILTVVKYAENVIELKEVFDKYKVYTGANSDQAMLSDYNSISGKTYTSLSACVDEFNASLNNNQGGSGGSGGGGGGGAGGGGGGGNKKPDDNAANNVGIAPPGGLGQADALSIKFEDLNSVQWAYTAISELYERKIINGKSETRFAPNDKVKREEFAKMMVDMAGLDIDTGVNSFSDVSDNSWYKDYVNTAFKNGFLSGVKDGVFGSGMEISRQDMCVIAYNVLNKLGHQIPSGELKFVDADDVSDYAKSSVAALNNAGIVNGIGDNSFNPRGSATRAEAAVIIFKLLKYIQ